MVILQSQTSMTKAKTICGIRCTYNLMPRVYLQIYNSVKSGNMGSARQLQSMANGVIQELIRTSPGLIRSIKHGLKMVGYDMGKARRSFLQIQSGSTRFKELVPSRTASSACPLFQHR